MNILWILLGLKWFCCHQDVFFDFKLCILPSWGLALGPVQFLWCQIERSTHINMETGEIWWASELAVKLQAGSTTIFFGVRKSTCLDHWRSVLNGNRPAQDMKCPDSIFYLFMFIHVYKFIYTVCIVQCESIDIYTYIYIWTNALIHIKMQAPSLSLSIIARIYIYIRIHIIHIYLCIYVHIYIYICMCVYIFL